MDCFFGSKIFCEQNSKLNSDCACNSLPRVLCISAEILFCNTEKPKYIKLSFELQWRSSVEKSGERQGGGEEKKVILRLHKPIRQALCIRYRKAWCEGNWKKQWHRNRQVRVLSENITQILHQKLPLICWRSPLPSFTNCQGCIPDTHAWNFKHSHLLPGLSQ